MSPESVGDGSAKPDPSKKKKPYQRRPIGVCAQCGEPAYKRRKIEAVIGPDGETSVWRMPLCHRHYEKHRRFGTFKDQRRSLSAEDIRWARIQHERHSAREVWRMLEQFRGVKVSYHTVYRRLREDYKPGPDER